MADIYTEIRRYANEARKWEQGTGEAPELDCRLFYRAAKEIEMLRLGLRDQFAMAALTGIAYGYFSNPQIVGLNPSDLAYHAYQYADAMMRARKMDDE